MNFKIFLHGGTDKLLGTFFKTLFFGIYVEKINKGISIIKIKMMKDG